MATDTELRAARLRQARAHAGFEEATEAAARFGWIVSTYLSHENGTRGIKPTVAKKYAKAFKISLSWLMVGDGLMVGPGLDAEVMEIPHDLAEPLIKTLRSLIDATKRRVKLRA